MNYRLNLGAWNSVFAVPAMVVDKYIKLASGDNIKVLLYFLRNAGAFFTSEDMASALGLNLEQIEEALLFWCQRGVIEIGNSGFEPARQPAVQAENNPVPPENKADNPAVKKVELLREPEFTPEEISAAVKNDEAVKFLFQSCEILLGRPLRHNEQASLAIIIEDTGIPVEVAAMMIDYCNSIGKLTPAYLKSLAADWMDEGITTIELAEKKIKRLSSYRDVEGEIKRLFEINTPFSKKQKEYINTWINDFSFSLEMIEEAYQRTLDNANKPSFQYMNKILRNWHENGITTLEDAKNEKKPSAIRKNNSKPSFDVNSLEQLALKKYNK